MQILYAKIFSAPCLAFNASGKDCHVAKFSVDIGGPMQSDLSRIIVEVRSEDRELVYGDGAQLFRCTLEGPPRLASLASGICQKAQDGDFLARMFHHTTKENTRGIAESGEIWSSPWNLAGTRKLGNVSYAYFTVLPKITNEDDLRQIAMSSTGKIEFQTTSERGLEDVLSLRVYRGNTLDRTEAIPILIPLRLISPPHLLIHPPVGGNSAYFEVVGFDIVRVGVNPGVPVQIASGLAVVDAPLRKNFSYVVLGDASSTKGLAAPFEEEDTEEIAHLENLGEEDDFFQFWLRNQNSDQVSGRQFESRIVSPE